MLATLRSGPGFRIAMSLALFAALCLVVPPAAMAFGHGDNTVHCLTNADTKDHGLGLQGHDAGEHQHGDHAQGPADKAPGCCGLYCLSALAPATTPEDASPAFRQGVPPVRATQLHSRMPEMRFRPPISTLSV
jgi:hypothetical protein